MGSAGTAAAAARQCGGSWQQTRKVLSPNDSRCDSIRGARWNRLAAAADGVRARVHGVRDLGAVGPRGGVAAHPRRVARPLAQTSRMLEKLPRGAASNRCAASRSCMLHQENASPAALRLPTRAVTTIPTAARKPSAVMSLLSPFGRCPPSHPRRDRGTVSAAGTVCESRTAAVGHRSRPARTRAAVAQRVVDAPPHDTVPIDTKSLACRLRRGHVEVMPSQATIPPEKRKPPVRTSALAI